MDFLNNAMLFLLQGINTFTHSYGWAILVLTLLIRLVLWPLNTAQTKSMKAMQALQPKMKEIQEKYKDDPLQLQKELMKAYGENKFNPLSGCLPMLLQIPVFIALYGALSSPLFTQLAGQESFFFIKHLHSSLHGNGGIPLDGSLAVAPDHLNFEAGQTIKVKLTGQPTETEFNLGQLRMNDAHKLLMVSPKPPIAGEPLTITLNQSDLGFDEAYLSRVEQVTVTLNDTKTKEVETVALKPTKGSTTFKAELPTTQANTSFHWDVLILIVIYGLLSWAYQQSMMAMSGQKPDPSKPNDPQALMNKLMPLMFTVMMFVIPIPAGVMLYLLMTMVMMVVQNMVLDAQEKRAAAKEAQATKPSLSVVDIKS